MYLFLSLVYLAFLVAVLFLGIYIQYRIIKAGIRDGIKESGIVDKQIAITDQTYPKVD